MPRPAGDRTQRRPASRPSELAATARQPELRETLLQIAIYCGIPAANATFHLAESVWDELGVESRQ